MINLLKETEETFKEYGYSPSDIIFIGSEKSGHSCTWEEYQVLANVEYNCGYGSQKVAEDLIIVFNDGGWLYRKEYDGSEWWSLNKPFRMPNIIKPITKLVLGENDYGSSLLAKLNDAKESEDEYD